LRGDLSGQLEVRQAADREDGKLLSSDQRGEPVYRGDPGDPRIPRQMSRGGVDGNAVDGDEMISAHRRPAVDRLSPPIADASKPLRPDRNAHGGPAEGDANVVEADP